jgi:hypothetical protein
VWCGGFERAGDVVQRRKKRTGQRIESKEKRGEDGRVEEITTTTTTTRKNTL